MGKMFDNAVCTRIWDASHASVMWLKLMPVVCSVLCRFDERRRLSFCGLLSLHRWMLFALLLHLKSVLLLYRSYCIYMIVLAYAVDTVTILHAK